MHVAVIVTYALAVATGMLAGNAAARVAALLLLAGVAARELGCRRLTASGRRSPAGSACPTPGTASATPAPTG